MDFDKKEKDIEEAPLNMMKQMKELMKGEEKTYKVELFLTAGQMIELGQFIKTVLHMKCPEGK